MIFRKKETENSTLDDKIWDSTKNFLTSWSEEFGYELTPQSIKAFEEDVHKAIIFYTIKNILED